MQIFPVAVIKVTPPYMRTAKFDSTGSKVDIVFDQEVEVYDSKDTRQDTPLIAVECSALFVDAVSLLGADAVCNLPSSEKTKLQIVLSSGAKLLPSVSAEAQTDVFSSAEAQRKCAPNMLSLRDNRVKSAKDKSISGLGCVRVASPSNPRPPVAVPVYQRRIGVCDDLTVRAASAVAASGGRPLEFSWDVAFFNFTEEIHLPADFPSLGKLPSATIAKAVMPNGTSSIRVTLKLRSIFHAETTTVIEVERVLNQLPAVELNARSSVLKRNKFIVAASGSIPPCEGDTNAAGGKPKFKYSWKLSSAPMQSGKNNNDKSSPKEKVNLAGLIDKRIGGKRIVRYTNKRESRIRFKPHALASCTTYSFNCTVAYNPGDGSSVSNWQTHEVAISQGNIVAIISGEAQGEWLWQNRELASFLSF